MNADVFLKKVLGSEGYYCLFAYKLGSDKLTQKFYKTVDELYKAAKDIDAQGYNAYYGLATFKESGSRKVSNVNQLKSFFLDLDCGETKITQNQVEALKALQKFCKSLNLPKPLLVNSGRGVHVYWLLDECISVEDWVPVAERLKKLCKENGLLADPAVTADAARVLRIPETHNHKSNPLQRLGILVRMYQSL